MAVMSDQTDSPPATSALLSFTARNVRSYWNEVNLSLLGTRLSDADDSRDSGWRSLGRDQIWLTEKKADGATTLYSMAEFRPKRDEALGRRYLQGRYGGVPVLDPAEFRDAADPNRS